MSISCSMLSSGIRSCILEADVLLSDIGSSSSLGITPSISSIRRCMSGGKIGSPVFLSTLIVSSFSGSACLISFTDSASFNASSIFSTDSALLSEFSSNASAISSSDHSSAESKFKISSSDIPSVSGSSSMISSASGSALSSASGFSSMISSSSGSMISSASGFSSVISSASASSNSSASAKASSSSHAANNSSRLILAVT